MKKNIICLLCLSFSYFLGSAQIKELEKGRIFAEPDLSECKVQHRVEKTQTEHRSYSPSTVAFDRTHLDAARVVNYNSNGEASYIKARLNTKNKFNSIQEEADAFLKLTAEKLKCDLSKTAFKFKSTFIDQLGEEHIRLTQTIMGIPLYGKEIILHKRNNAIHLLNGDYASVENQVINTNFDLTENSIKEIVQQTNHTHTHVGSEMVQENFGIDFKQWDIHKVYYESGGNFIPAFEVIYYPHLAERLEFVIDANTGEYLENYSSLCKFHTHEHLPPDGPATANALDLLGQNRTINTYEFSNRFYMLDGSRTMFNPALSNLPDDPVGAIWTIDANNTAPQNSNFKIEHVQSTTNSWNSSPEAVSAQFNAGAAYEYFKIRHAREGMSGTGDNIVSIVNVAAEDGSSMGNAFWNGFAIFYGNGDDGFFPLGRGLDVAGHEMSHGVIQNTANLRYQGESGALNESFADVFGAMIDRDDWTIGEDVVKTNAFPSGALRNLEDPHNGAATNDFARGWQPKHLSEKYNGSQDNGGVHINSGIPNHVFYRIADQIGRAPAEQIFYRALTVYLTKSSNFIDFRNAILASALDLYSQDEQLVAVNALIAVGLNPGQGGGGADDVDLNPGQDIIWYSSEGRDSMFIRDAAGTLIGPNPLIEIDHISRPSISDDGSRVAYVGSDKKIHGVAIDWPGDTYDPTIFWEDSPMWRNAVISKQGDKIAALTDDLNNKIIVMDLSSGAMKEFELYNPTFTQGIETGEVAYADALEWDHTGTHIMYDAKSIITNTSGVDIEFWDIGFLNVWNAAAETFALGNISKLFSSIPDNINIGNPSFSKNSPYIIAFDYIEESSNSILGVNSETGEVKLIKENTGLGYPNYSNDDRSVVYDVPFIQNGSLAGYDIGRVGLSTDKITGISSTAEMLEFYARWPVWFSNGERVLSEVVDLGEGEFDVQIFPVPAKDRIQIQLSESQENLQLRLLDLNGKLIKKSVLNSDSKVLNLADLSPGTYVLKLMNETSQYTKKIVKL